MSEPWPTELRLTAAGTLLNIRFESGAHYVLSAEFLRVESPSAEVRGHGPSQQQLVYGKRLVTITAIEPVGTYAVRLIFNDGHTSGIYTWSYLNTLGQEGQSLWNSYIAKLASQGRQREPT